MIAHDEAGFKAEVGASVVPSAARQDGDTGQTAQARQFFADRDGDHNPRGVCDDRRERSVQIKREKRRAVDEGAQSGQTGVAENAETGFRYRHS
jgi:hypothetical protein